MHPGESKYYNRMIKVRKEREIDRNAFKLAKACYYSGTNITMFPIAQILL